MRKVKALLLAAGVVGALVLPAVPASACQPDGPCPCSDEPGRTINREWRELTGQNFFQCTY